jgi:beta-N-acetylhexosaminidase
VLVCNKPESVIQVIDGLKVKDDALRHMRLVRLHGRHGMDRDELFASQQWKQAANTVLSYAPDPERELI